MDLHQAGTFYLMAIPKALASLAGNWTGKNLLNLPWAPECQQLFESTTTLNLWVSGREEIAAVHYTWEHEGNIHAGALVIASTEAETTVGWSDTWHQKESVLLMKGPTDETLDVVAPYAEDSNGQWRWRIKLSGGGMSLTLEMFNISPSGEETWAVRGAYNR